MEKVNKVGKIIETIIENILIIFLIIMVSLVFINASLRYVFRFGILSSEELARFFFFWMCYLACIVVHMKKGHIRVTFVVDMLPLKAQKVVNALARLIAASALAYLTWGAFLYVEASSKFMNQGIKLNFGLIVSVLLISAAGMLLIDIIDFVKFVIQLIRPDRTVKEAGEEKV